MFGFPGECCLGQTVKQIECGKIQNTVCSLKKCTGDAVGEKGLTDSRAAVQKEILCTFIKIVYKVPGSIISPFGCFAGG